MADLPRPLLVDPNVLIIARRLTVARRPGDAQGRSIALPKEAPSMSVYAPRFPNLRLIGTDSEYEAFGMVSNRKADMTLRSRIVAGQNIREKGWFNLKIASEVPELRERAAHGRAEVAAGVTRSVEWRDRDNHPGRTRADHQSPRRDQDGYRHCRSTTRRRSGSAWCWSP